MRHHGSKFLPSHHSLRREGLRLVGWQPLEGRWEGCGYFRGETGDSGLGTGFPAKVH